MLGMVLTTLTLSKDCQFCQDPLLDRCYLVYPGENLLQTGPYNRAYAQKLLNDYRQHEHLKDRIMMVDEDLLSYLMMDPADRSHDLQKSKVLKRLAAECAANIKGSPPGPLMQQEALFDRLWNKNNIMKHEITQGMLTGLKEVMVVAGAPLMCYCRNALPRGMSNNNVVECSHRDCRFKFFHKTCVKDLGTDLVSRWYCTECHGKMQLLAYKTLRDLGFDDVPDEDTVLDRFHLNAFDEGYTQMDEAMNDICATVGRMPSSTEIINAFEGKVSMTVGRKK